MASRTLLMTSLGAAGAAIAGGLATEPGAAWYQGLSKPGWQPPKQAFPLVWTPLYGMIAWGTARAVDSAPAGEKGALGRAVAVNLLLNAGWPALFFGARSPRGALAEIAALNVSNAVLLRRAWRADRTAAAALVPYALWTGFATALNASIVRRNA